MKPERVETARLILRRPRQEDADAMFTRYASDPVATRFLAWPTHAAIDSTRAFVEFSDVEWERWPAGPYLVERRDDGALIGGSGFGFETPTRAATGYVLAQDTWGKGYATDVLQAIVEVARGLAVVRLYGLCHVEHAASARVMEKCGFGCEGAPGRHTEFPNLGREGPADVFCYAIILK